jgi:hypothetical protein
MLQPVRLINRLSPSLENIQKLVLSLLHSSDPSKYATGYLAREWPSGAFLATRVPRKQYLAIWASFSKTKNGFFKC